MVRKKRLHVIYIRPSTYDDDGYVLRYWRGVLPSNTLACLASLTQSVAQSGALGADVAVTVNVYDDTVQRIPIRKIARLNRRPDTTVVVGFAGVQTNQFPRAADLALELRAHGVQVMIGGFHVSGMLALFDEPSYELQPLLDAGVALVKGEAEAPGVLAGILRDALNGGLKPVYDITEFPDLEHAPVPHPHERLRNKFLMRKMATIDTSRGCPFNCSFCTIINVQGRKMRHRSAACVLEAIEENYARGISAYFFTDDNFSRNPVWEEILDGLIAIRERGLDVIFMMQVDALAHRIPRFVEKAERAGCYLAFVGMETVNPKNLEAVGKHHNDVDDYADMVRTWHRHKVQVHAGYIIGLPYDTRKSLHHDIEVLTNQVRVDFASLFMLVPLPGSRDHWQMVENCVPLDADHNNYDGLHETFRHARLAPGQWRAAYDNAMTDLYSKENVVNVLLRLPKEHRRHMFWTLIWYRYCALEGLHPMSTGLFRRKERKARRPAFARESVPQYAWRRVKDSIRGGRRYVQLFFDFQEVWMLTRKPEDLRWQTLADLRAKWADVRLRIEESDVRGRYDDAARELKAMLASTADRLRQLSRAPRGLSFRARRRLRRQAREVEGYLRQFDVQVPEWRTVARAEQYVSEKVVAGYEEVAIRYVAKRRRFNAYRKDLVERLKTGRLLTLDLARLPYALLFEVLFAVRFGFGVLAQK